MTEIGGQELWLAMGAPEVSELDEPPVDICAGCGQTILTTPDDPMQALWCDTCQGGVK